MIQAQLHQLFPRFVLHKVYDEGATFNARLAGLAREDNLARRAVSGDERDATRPSPNYLMHQRYNFLRDCIDPTVRRLVQMIDETARDYLRAVYRYEHDGELELMADTFLQRKSHNENTGINAHAHQLSQMVVTYYPRVVQDEAETDRLRRGALRFYDPQMVNGRHWPNNNPQVFSNAWFNLEPQTGSMVAFEGHMVHDSTFFAGEERICIACMVNVVTPRSHCKESVSSLLEHQG